MTDAPLTEYAARRMAQVFKALGDPARLRLLSLIAAQPAGEACNRELVALLGLSQPTVSHHVIDGSDSAARPDSYLGAVPADRSRPTPMQMHAPSAGHPGWIAAGAVPDHPVFQFTSHRLRSAPHEEVRPCRHPWPPERK